MERIAWEDLPDDLRSAIEKRTGPILHAQTMTAGQNSPVSAAVTTATGKTFVKGLPAADRRASSQVREAAVAPLVRHISPALLWQFEETGWHVLGYEHIEGRHADYSPSSPDPAALVPVMVALGEVEVPDPVPFKRAEDRFKTYVDDQAVLSAFHGRTLQHTDWVPQNVLVAADRPYLIDWAWPTLGAPWMDPAYFLLGSWHPATPCSRRNSGLPSSQRSPRRIPAHRPVCWGERTHVGRDRAPERRPPHAHVDAWSTPGVTGVG